MRNLLVWTLLGPSVYRAIFLNIHIRNVDIANLLYNIMHRYNLNYRSLGLFDFKAKVQVHGRGLSR